MTFHIGPSLVRFAKMRVSVHKLSATANLKGDFRAYLGGVVITRVYPAIPSVVLFCL